MHHKLYYIGTSGYNYNSWNKNFYHTHNKLNYYSSIFNSVEINSTYYYNYSSEIWKKWGNETPSNFKFSIKVNRSVVNSNDKLKLIKNWNNFWKG